jgi:hypothetical protein
MDECIKRFEFFWAEYSENSSRIVKDKKIIISQDHVDKNFNKVIDYVAMMLISIAKDMYGENAIKFVEKGYELNQIPLDDPAGRSKTNETMEILNNVKIDELLLRINIIIRKPEQFPEILAGYFTTVNCYKVPQNYSTCKPVVEFMSFLEVASTSSVKQHVANIVRHNTLVSAKIALCALILNYTSPVSPLNRIIEVLHDLSDYTCNSKELLEIIDILRANLRGNKEKVLKLLKEDNAVTIFIALCQ